MSKSNQRGFILLTVMTTTVFVMMIGIASLELISSNLRSARAERYLVSAQFAADAGLDDAIRRLNQDGTWTGTGTEQTLYNSSEYRTTYLATVTDGSDEFQKFISVEARAYVPASATSALYTRKYTTEMRGVASGNYSVVSGVGGLTMTNSAKILGGQVYVNGELSMDNTAQIGLSNLAVNVNVAHQSCPLPADATYPRVCNSGENGEPIEMLSPNTKIYGEVKGTNQTNGANMFNPGLVSGSPAPAPLPTHDRTAQKNAVASTTSGAVVSCSSNSSYTWTANTKIVGNVSLSKCDVTVEGDIWITGKVTMTNGAKLRVKSGLTVPPVIMIDGDDGLSMRNSSQFVSNTNPTPVGFRVITYASDASCSPDCSSVTGTDLYDSRDNITISIENTSDGPQTEFFARWSKVTLSNSGNIGALAGQTVEMTNSAAITFGTSITGFTGPQAWVVKSYKRTF
jgi:Tfp pilus assembly protein PilX